MTHINRILLLCFLLFYTFSFSQETNNPFNLSETETYENSRKNDNQFASPDQEVNLDQHRSGPPGDDDSVPIDKNIFILVGIALLIIGYSHVRRKPSEI